MSETTCGCYVPRLETPFGDDIEYCSLHAAAPELLEACEEIVRVTHPGDPGRGMARAAIAKAKGEQ